MCKLGLVAGFVTLAFVTFAASASAAVPTNSSPPGIEPTTPAVGMTLVESPGSWTGSVTSLSIQWLACDANGQACEPIPSANGTTYLLLPPVLGDTIRVQEIASNADGTSAPAVSSPTAVVIALMYPVITVRPWPSGQAAVGATVSVSQGIWSGGTMPVTFSYQWQRCSLVPAQPGHVMEVCNSIPGATNQTYTVSTADAGYDLLAAVTFINPAGQFTITSSYTNMVPTGIFTGSSYKGLALPRYVPSVPWILQRGGVTGWFKARSAGRLDVTWYAWVNGKHVLIAQARRTFRRRGLFKVRTVLTRAGRAALESNYLLGVYLTARFTPPRNSLIGSGGPSVLTPTVL
jgi:hypothetical protein